jgi:hypothetical protein
MQSLGQKILNSNLSNLTRVKAIGISDVRRLRLAKLPESYILKKWPVRTKNNAQFFPIVTVPGMANLSEAKTENDGGVSYVSTVEMFLPNDSSAIRLDLEQYREEMYILATQDGNGVMRLIGTLETPCKMSEAFTTAGEKGRKIQFLCESLHRPYYLSSIKDADLVSNINDVAASL